MELSPIIKQLLIELKRLSHYKLNAKIQDFDKPVIERQNEQPPIPDFIFDAKTQPIQQQKSVNSLKDISEFDAADYCYLFEAIFSFKYCKDDLNVMICLKDLYRANNCFKSLLNHLAEKAKGDTQQMYSMLRMLIRN